MRRIGGARIRGHVARLQGAAWNQRTDADSNSFFRWAKYGSIPLLLNSSAARSRSLVERPKTAQSPAVHPASRIAFGIAATSADSSENIKAFTAGESTAGLCAIRGCFPGVRALLWVIRLFASWI